MLPRHQKNQKILYFRTIKFFESYLLLRKQFLNELFKTNVTLFLGKFNLTKFTVSTLLYKLHVNYQKQPL